MIQGFRVKKFTVLRDLQVNRCALQKEWMTRTLMMIQDSAVGKKTQVTSDLRGLRWHVRCLILLGWNAPPNNHIPTPDRRTQVHVHWMFGTQPVETHNPPSSNHLSHFADVLPRRLHKEVSKNVPLSGNFASNEKHAMSGHQRDEGTAVVFTLACSSEENQMTSLGHGAREDTVNHAGHAKAKCLACTCLHT